MPKNTSHPVLSISFCRVFQVHACTVPHLLIFLLFFPFRYLNSVVFLLTCSLRLGRAHFSWSIEIGLSEQANECTVMVKLVCVWRLQFLFPRFQFERSCKKNNNTFNTPNRPILGACALVRICEVQLMCVLHSVDSVHIE